jgi:hypothetical protein
MANMLVILPVFELLNRRDINCVSSRIESRDLWDNILMTEIDASQGIVGVLAADLLGEGGDLLVNEVVF